MGVAADPATEHGASRRRDRDRPGVVADHQARQTGGDRAEPSGDSRSSIARSTHRRIWSPKGAYVLSDCDGTPDVLLLATGSEVQLALAAQDTLAGDGVKARVVSMPCLEWFAEQDQSYQDEVLPPAVTARVSIEAGVTIPWWKYVGGNGRTIGLDHFGASADARCCSRSSASRLTRS